MNLFKKVFSIYEEKNHRVACILGIKIKIRDLRKEIYALKKDLEERILQNEYKIRKLLPVTSIGVIETHIVDHCNLNCKGCHHFAPL